jgi:hypothetical protein
LINATTTEVYGPIDRVTIMSFDEEHLHAEPDYKPRSHYGVVSCLQLLESGEVRLILDDVCSRTDHWPQVWQSHWPFTRQDFAGKVFLACQLTEEQLADIGRNLVARLSALTTNTQQ